MAENQLVNCAGFQNLDNLGELNLSQNQITTLVDMKALPALKKLDVSKNQIASLADMPELMALEWLSLDENQIDKLDELPNLRGLESLNTLNLAGNPIAEEKGDEIKKEVLIALDNLVIKFVNGEDGEVTQEDRDDAKNEKAERIR